MNFMFRWFRSSASFGGYGRIGAKLIQKHRVANFSEKSMEGLVRCAANDVPLSPISFLERAATVYSDRTSLIYGTKKYTWKQTHERCHRLASALAQLGISRGDVVAALSPNVPAMHELHFGVPMAGAVLCTLNIRYNSNMLAHVLQHSEAKIIFVDSELLDLASNSFGLLSKNGNRKPLLVLINESNDQSSDEDDLMDSNNLEYENLLETGHPHFEIRHPKDEWDPITLNYTSGTTSSPKGVVYNHRGAYLNALSTILFHGIRAMPVYLWTVPMFHCNGWCLNWGLTAQGGTNVCLRKVTAKAVYDHIAAHKVTHLGGAPTVLNMIANAPLSDRKPLPGKVELMTGGSPPPPQILFKMEELGFNVTHIYGLTETYGPATYTMWKPEWDSLPSDEQAKLRARQGVQHLGIEVDVKDPITLKSVPSDGQTMGEVMFRGNTVMSGYLKNLKATQEAFDGGYFRTGDLAVKHSDGYLEVKDRSKDIIISGGENICSIEVETVLYGHPAVFEAAVVGRPDNHWGETPCAFVKLKEGFGDVNAEDIIKFCRDRLPHYMAPRSVVFEELPRTSTGKVQKFILREKAKAMGSLS